jgi:hypothetical protein
MKLPRGYRLVKAIIIVVRHPTFWIVVRHPYLVGCHTQLIKWGPTPQITRNKRSYNSYGSLLEMTKWTQHVDPTRQ